jgi:hypothetical protein
MYAATPFFAAIASTALRTHSCSASLAASRGACAESGRRAASAAARVCVGGAAAAVSTPPRPRAGLDRAATVATSPQPEGVRRRAAAQSSLSSCFVGTSTRGARASASSDRPRSATRNVLHFDATSFTASKCSRSSSAWSARQNSTVRDVAAVAAAPKDGKVRRSMRGPKRAITFCERDPRSTSMTIPLP